MLESETCYSIDSVSNRKKKINQFKKRVAYGNSQASCKL